MVKTYRVVDDDDDDVAIDVVFVVVVVTFLSFCLSMTRKSRRVINQPRHKSAAPPSHRGFRFVREQGSDE